MPTVHVVIYLHALNNDHRVGDIFKYVPFNGLKLRKGEDVKPLPPNQDPRQPKLSPWNKTIFIPTEKLTGARLALEGVIARQWGNFEYKWFPRLSPSGNGQINLDLESMVKNKTELVSVVTNYEASLELRIQFRVTRVQ